MLNVDTKIISKALALRLKNVLHEIICHDQTAYVKGRFIGESTRLISDILEITDIYMILKGIFSPQILKRRSTPWITLFCWHLLKSLVSVSTLLIGSKFYLMTMRAVSLMLVPHLNILSFYEVLGKVILLLHTSS